MFFATSVAAVIAYLAATGAHLGTIFGDRPRLQRLALVATSGAALIHFVLAGLLFADSGFAGAFEVRGAVTLGALALVVVYLFLAFRFELESLGSFVTPLAALGVMVNVIGEGPSGTHLPLGNELLVTHITLAFLATGAFSLACIMSIVYLIQENQLKQKKFGPLLQRFPSLDRLDGFGLKFVATGFAMYTVSLLLGLFWAWRHDGLAIDGRSGLSVLTWVIYAIIIQARITVGWRGRVAAQLVIIGGLSAVGVIILYLTRAPA